MSIVWSKVHEEDSRLRTEKPSGNPDKFERFGRVENLKQLWCFTECEGITVSHLELDYAALPCLLGGFLALMSSRTSMMTKLAPGRGRFAVP